MRNVLDGLMQMRTAFMRANLKPPTVMLLESHEEGVRFLNEITLVDVIVSPDLTRVVEMADGSAWMERKVMNIAVRWPANRVARPDGCWSYV